MPASDLRKSKKNGGRHKPRGNAPGSEPWSKKPPEDRPSSRGVMRPISDQTNWRVRLRPDYIKFDDPLKGRFLDELLKHGKRALAAQACDISMQTVRDHMKIDPEFERLFNEVLSLRADLVTEQIEREALEGFEEPIFNTKTGDLLGTRRVYETPLRLAILRRYDPEYKDRSDVTVHGAVGVLVAPAQMSPQQWIEQEQARNEARQEPGREMIDVTPERS